MESGILIHTTQLNVAGRKYEVAVYVRADGWHVARTVFSPGDIIIHDGPSLEEVLDKHQRLLPLAIDSRQLLSEIRCGGLPSARPLRFVPESSGADSTTFTKDTRFAKPGPSDPLPVPPINAGLEREYPHPVRPELPWPRE